MARAMRRSLVILFAFAAACGAPPSTNDVPPAGADDDLPLGDRLPDDLKIDGNWGAALTCKSVPSLPTLPNPEIIISLKGLTVHLVDRTVGFDKVFPAGVGKIDDDDANSTYGDTLSAYPLNATGKNTFTLYQANIQPCKTWWTDPETGEKSPVFAGLPFMPFYGGYALHGPIDNFRAPNGGSLRRGFVSHGCIRMESADVLELYARIRGVAAIPVRVEREPERDASGRRIDVASRWVGAECTVDADCNYPGGICKQNAWSGRGYCTASCTRACADRAGQPTTFCVADPDAPAASTGICVTRTGTAWPDCRQLDSFVAETQPRKGQTVTASVCVPGSRGWIGDRCLDAADCEGGTSCVAGVCTQPCTRVCADRPGWPTTFCARNDGALGDTCLRTCTPASNAPECPGGFRCVERARPGSTTKRFVCVP
jgi:hypothetical protein